MKNEIAIINEVNAVEVYTNDGMVPLLDKLERDVLSFVPDISTVKGRKEIASIASKVAKSKTYLDGLGKDLTADWKKKSKVVDAERKKMRDRLDALKIKVRQPLTDFEEAEKKRVADLEARVQNINKLGDIYDADNEPLSSKELTLNLVTAKRIDIESFEDRAADAAVSKERVVSILESAFEQAVKREREQEELERLRIEAEEQRKREQEEKIRREAEEKAKREAEEEARKERERVQREKEEVERKAREEQERFEREKREAEEAKQRELEKAEAKRLADIKAAEEKAELERQELIRQRQGKERKERERVEAEKEAERKRQADVEHRMAINNNVLVALSNIGINDIQGKAIIEAIVKGHVPHVIIKY